MKQLTYGIIGTGKLGAALAKALNRTGELKWVVARSDESKARVDFLTEESIYETIAEVPELSDFIFITVNDPYISDVADYLCEIFRDGLKDRIVVHCSGTLGANELTECTKYGALIAAAHPFQTFYYANDDVFGDVPWGIEAGDNIKGIVEESIVGLGGKPIHLSDKSIANKELYHATAVIASNFLTSVIKLSANVAKKANIKPEEFLANIINTTVKNNLHDLHADSGLPLTGPFARGDIATIAKHVNALKGDHNLLAAYRNAGLLTLEMSYRAGYINEKMYEDIIKIMSD